VPNSILTTESSHQAVSTHLSNWYAIYTRVNQEKIVAERLRERGIDHFLPLYETVRRRSDRRVLLNLPLFPGYLFVKIPLEERLRVLQIPRVVRIVGNSSAPVPLPETEIETLQLGLASGAKAKPCEYLNKGCRVRLTRGPFAGMTGILVRRKAGFRLVVSIDAIQQAFTVEVGEEDLQRIH
jgi:transcription antitermination factor NusG